MNRRETERILDVIGRARAAGQRTALATVVRIKGSAYRREGARIIVRQDGSYECLLSGGCLEPAVAEAAARVIETGVPAIERYDLEEDSIWGLGIGCSGAVDIRIERVDDDPMTRLWLAVLERADAAVLVTTLSGPARRLVVREQDVAGSLGDARLNEEATVRARTRLAERFPRSGPDAIDGTEVFYDVSTPPPELVMFGAGFDATPLARQAWDLGFAVTIVDVRAGFLTPERFPHMTLVPAHFTQFAGRVRLTSRTFVVIMNHHLERDRECLRFALASGAPYVGALGPRSRLDKLLAALAAEGSVPGPDALARVRSPVGLALGAETPEEIAVSILGEIIALQRAFDGGFLNGRTAGLHRSADARLFARS